MCYAEPLSPKKGATVENILIAEQKGPFHLHHSTYSLKHKDEGEDLFVMIKVLFPALSKEKD